MTDNCLTRPRMKAASATVYLMEELGDARMRCDQLVKAVAQATKLIERSSHRDHFFEVAGDLIQTIPKTLFLLQKSLQATALAALRLDYEEIKQDLRPEKVDELERALQDVRIRQVQRRSQPLTPSQVLDTLKAVNAQVRDGGALPRAELQALVQDLEFGLKQATDQAQALEAIMASITTASEPPSRLHLANQLRQILADDLLTAEPTMTPVSAAWKTNTTVTAAEDEKQSKFEEGKPADPTENMDPADAKKWKTEHAKNKDNFKSAAQLGPEVKLDFETAALALRNASRGVQPKNNSLTAVAMLASALGKMGEERASDVLMRAHAVMKSSGMWDTSGKEASSSDFPTLNKLAQNIAGNLDSLKKDCKDLAAEMGKVEGWYAPDITEAEVQKLGQTAGEYRKKMFGWGGISFVRKKEASEEDKQSKFEEGKPADPTENMSPADAKKWKVEHLKNKDNFKASSAEEAKRSRFEEGKPADPTENMDPADAKKWKTEHDKNKDNFKSAYER